MSLTDIILIVLGSITALVNLGLLAIEVYKLGWFRKRIRIAGPFSDSTSGAAPALDKWRAALALLSLVGLGLFMAFTLHYKTRLDQSITQLQQAQTTIKDDTTPKPPATNMDISIPVPLDICPAPTTGPYSIFAIGKKTLLTVCLTNLGPQVADNAVWKYGFRVLDKVSAALTQREEDEAFATFKKTEGMHLGDLSIGSMQFQMATATQTLDKDAAYRLQNDFQRLYVLEDVTFEDLNGQHEIESCLWLQSPGTFLYWHDCVHHNITRWIGPWKNP